jgi:hypothetical protein
MNELRTRDRIGACGTWLPMKVASDGTVARSRCVDGVLATA